MRRLSVLLTLFWLLAGAARAEVAVLVHGYLSSAASWGASGVESALIAHGWRPGGALLAGPTAALPASTAAPGEKVFYSVELPSTAPLAVQSDLLLATLEALEARHPGEAVSLVGHSAGGVVARMALVKAGPQRVSRLVTIAAPHLGTGRALQALDATDSSGPFGFIKDWLGGDLYHVVKGSWPILLDLAPPHPGSALYWLNAQPHPDIGYVSVVRTGPQGLAGDELVPAFSQDMNQVPALRGRARTLLSPASHALAPGDGVLVARVLAGEI